MATTPSPEKPLTVLVADDMAGSRQVMADMVREIGYTAVEVNSGHEALYLLDTQPPDIILLDLLMPHIDGFEVVKQVRQRIRGHWIPVIVVSSLEGDEHFALALAKGAADYMVKPVKFPILRAKLRQFERVLAQQDKLALLARRHQAINDHIADPIVTVDENGVVQELNQAARQLFQVANPNGAELSLHRLAGMGLEHLIARQEIELTFAGKEPRQFSVSHSHWQIGLNMFCTIALHDLSEVRRIERMKDEFLATVSHELRTPLTSILGALGLMAAGAGGQLPAGASELATVAKRNGDRLSRLIDDVLDLTKLEGNRMPLNLRLLEVAPLIAEAVEANTSYAQRGGVKLVFEPEPASVRARLDPDRFLQIMANLLSNAIKHSPKGGTVRIVLYSLPSSLRIEVSDEGPGIDPAFRVKLFEKFSQADSSDRRAIGGTGLGLYISRMLVDKMGGTIAATSQTAASAGSNARPGSTFHISFPRSVTNPDGPWLLSIAQDQHLQARLSEWLSDVVRVESVHDLASAETAVKQLGQPVLVLAQPNVPSQTHEFCRRLLNKVRPQQLMLIGDALDAEAASQHGVPWISVSAVSRQSFSKRVQELLSDDGMER
jgi:signal transduction histidine kinase